LQCVAVCCIVLQCVAVCCSVLQCVAVCCSVLQCVAEDMHNRRDLGEKKRTIVETWKKKGGKRNEWKFTFG